MEFLQENGLYLLFVGAMMFMMFRNGGCCGGHSSQGHGGSAHGSHGGGCGDSHSTNNRNTDAQAVDMVKDPICGMHINPSTAIHEMINGKSYYFCSEHCRNEFHRRQ